MQFFLNLYLVLFFGGWVGLELWGWSLSKLLLLGLQGRRCKLCLAVLYCCTRGLFVFGFREIFFVFSFFRL